MSHPPLPPPPPQIIPIGYACVIHSNTLIVLSIVVLEFSWHHPNWITMSLNQDALDIIWFIEIWEHFLTNNASVSVTPCAILHMHVLYDETYIA